MVLELFFRLLERTVRLEVIDRHLLTDALESGKSVIVACPHNVLLPALLAARGLHVAFLVSRSRDGELVSRVLERRGFRVVRGSSSRGGSEALGSLKSLVKSEACALAIAFDGPKGPPLVPKPGVVALALTGQCRLCFVAVELMPSWFWWKGAGVRLGSWDRFLLILPFARCRIRFELAPDDPITTWQQSSAALAWIESRARALYGHITPRLKVERQQGQ